MIPDFKTYLRESLWSDIQDRNSGEVTRKEDDVNFMDFETFGEYLRNFNKKEVTRVYLDPKCKFITIDEIDIILETKERSYERHYPLLLTIEYSESKEVKDIHLPYSFKSFERNVYSKMTKEFSISIKRNTDLDLNISYLHIDPKDGSKKTNRFFLDVLNFLVENLTHRYLNESVWSDIQDRNSGEVMRKEDDVNLLDMKGLKKYLQDHYKPLEETYLIRTYDWGSVKQLNLPLFKNDGVNHSYWHVDLIMQFFESDDDRYIYLPSRFVSNCMLLKTLLQKEFETEIVNEEHGRSHLHVLPKDGTKTTNKFFLDVLDFLIENLARTPEYDKVIDKK